MCTCQRHEYVAVPVRGNCMEPRIPEGARVIVDKPEDPKTGDIVVAMHKAETVVKQLTRQNGKLLLIPLQGQAAIEVTEHTEIVGVVKYWGMKP